MVIQLNDIQNFESRYRAKLINSLSGFRQVSLIGTQSKLGIANLAIFNSLIHLSANPPLWGLVFRPDTVQRDTLDNILETGVYSINYVSSNYFQQAHQTSAKYDSNISEFEAVGFKTTYDSDFLAPFVEEATVKIAMKLEQVIPIELNGTKLLIGSIQRINLKESMLKKDGFVALNEEQIIASSGLDAYYKTELLGRLNYAQPNIKVSFLEI